MTTTNIAPKPFVALPPVEACAVASATMLSQEARDVLLAAINGTRMGVFLFSVACEYDKQTKAKPRIEGETYVGLPGTTSKLHLGTLVAAPTNKEGEVYLRVFDMARADGESAANWTALKLSGLKSFQVRGASPGPLAPKPTTSAS
jgi:hypothetical protein